MEVGDKAADAEVPVTAAVVLPPSQQHFIGGEAGIYRSVNRISGGMMSFEGRGVIPK